MESKKYLAGYIAGGLLLINSVKAAELFIEYKDWQIVKDNILKNNIFQLRTKSALSRICSEVISRLKHLSTNELEFLVIAVYQEQGYLLWIAICRRYKIIAEFALEVLRANFLKMDLTLYSESFDFFFESKVEYNPELESIRDSTKYKMKQVLFKMLKEAEIVNEVNLINQIFISKDFYRAIQQDKKEDILYLPIYEPNAKGI
ncbi:MAG: DUF1819 family protein [Candidatus Muirbacterium halophilum]|nr:DUF1819 family protein [Candidatus Muirbacterium halophilum]